MSFFKKLFGKKEEPLPVNEDIFIETARLISGHDQAVLDKLAYWLEHCDEYIENEGSYRGLTPDTNKPLYDIYLLAMIDALIEHGYMKEFDWKEDSGEILRGVEAIGEKLALKFKPQMDLGFLDDDEDADNLEPERVFTLIACFIAHHKYCLAAIDINSDSYPVCLLPHKDFKKCEQMLFVLDIKMIDY